MIKFGFNEDYVGAITIRHRIEEITGKNTSISIDFCAPKIIEVAKEAYYNWPEKIEARANKNVYIYKHKDCKLKGDYPKWEITPNTGVNNFSLKISTKGVSDGGDHHGEGDTEPPEGNGNGVTVTIGEP
ncbi:MAG: hypothetical protein QG657_498 [Acidobacteriota bacterium]|nr:hypothetical protein [Acidobacteriota bacterium]